MSNPKLSVCCITYNHAPFLEQAIESVINQIVDFEFEVIIGDDCSTDGSQKILKRYAERYPELIKLILQPVNTGGKKNFNDVYCAATGEYVIALETDDYWTDSNKLKMQVDFLNHHPECIAVAHNCNVVNANGQDSNQEYPSIKSGWYTYRDFMHNLMPGQTTTLMYRNILLDATFDKSLWLNNVPGPGDLKKVFSFLAHGKIYTLPYYMSAYRHVSICGTSFSANHKRDDVKAIKYYLEFHTYALKFNNKQLLFAADVKLVQTAIGALIHKSISFKEFLLYIKLCNNPIQTIYHSLYNIYKIKASK